MMDCAEKDGSPVALDPRHIVRTAVERLAKLGYTATVATGARVLPLRRVVAAAARRDPVLRHHQGRRAGADPVRHPPQGGGVRHRRRGLQLRVRPVRRSRSTSSTATRCRWPTTRRCSSRPSRRSPASTACARRSCRSRSPASPATARTSTSRCATPTATNAFAPKDLDDPFFTNALMKRCVAGLLHHQLELAAIGSPTINAYKRFEDYSFAPDLPELGRRQPLRRDPLRRRPGTGHAHRGPHRARPTPARTCWSARSWRRSATRSRTSTRCRRSAAATATRPRTCR